MKKGYESNTLYYYQWKAGKVHFLVKTESLKEVSEKGSCRADAMQPEVHSVGTYYLLQLFQQRKPGRASQIVGYWSLSVVLERGTWVSGG